jgi:hypothetical protein
VRLELFGYDRASYFIHGESPQQEMERHSEHGGDQKTER